MTTMRAFACVAAVLLTSACAGGSTSSEGDVSVDSLTSAELAAVPELTVSDGTVLCTADGYDDCPLRSAYANRLDDDRFAVWEPGKSLLMFRAGDTAFVRIGSMGSGADQYGVIGAVRSLGGDRMELIELARGPIRLKLDAAGAVTDRDTLAILEGEMAVGFVDRRVVLQRITNWTRARGGEFTVSVVDQVTDTTGQMMLRVPIPWMQGTADSLLIPPLIADIPVYAVTRDGGLVWSAGTAMMIERRDDRAQPQWRVHGPRGPAITADDLDRREAELREAAALLPLTDADYANMRSRTDSLHPAVTNLVVSPRGDVFAALASVPTRDSVEWVLINRSGVTEGRFHLSRLTRVLLAEDDSLLVHRPTGGEPWEIRWLRLGRTP